MNRKYSAMGFLCLLLSAVSFTATSQRALPENHAHCINHLSNMMVGNTLNLGEWSCQMRDDNDMAVLVSFLDEHPEVTELNMVDPTLFETHLVSLKPLAANKTLLKLTASVPWQGDIRDFSGNTTLRSLTLSGKVSDEDIVAIALANTNLESFTYHAFDTKITDKSAIALASNDHLIDVCLPESSAITTKGYLAVASKPGLSSACLGGDDEVLYALAQQKKLKSLNLYAKNMTGQAILILANNTEVTTLSINHADKTAVVGIAGNSKIHDLTIRNSDIGAEGLTALGNMSSLTRLKLLFNHIPDQGYAVLAQLPKLAELDITTLYDDVTEQNKVFEDRFFIAAGKNKALKSLSLFFNGARITYMSPKNYEALAQSKSLQHLSITNHDNFTTKSASALAKNQSLRSLSLVTHNMNDDAAKKLARMHLTSLNLDGNNTTNAAAIALAQNRYLQKINLSWNPVGNDGIAALATNTRMTHLWLDKNIIDDKNAALFANHRSLKFLSVYLSELTPAGLDWLTENPNFVTLVY